MVQPDMTGRWHLKANQSEAPGYTLIELLMVVILISVLGGAFLSTQSSTFVGYSRLKLAGSELAGAMAKARDTAAKNITIDTDCSIIQTVNKSTTDVSTTLSPANCISTTLLPNAINLRARSGAANLSVDQTTVYTFRSEGMSTNADSSITDQTVRLSDPRSDTVICVNLTIPTAIIRLGLIKSGSTSCDYTSQ